LDPVSTQMGGHTDVMRGHTDEAAGFCRNIVMVTVMKTWLSEGTHEVRLVLSL
jgi:hypothetical protein